MQQSIEPGVVSVSRGGGGGGGGTFSCVIWPMPKFEEKKKKHVSDRISNWAHTKPKAKLRIK